MEFGKEYIKTFDTEAQYLAFKASSGYNEPNVSYISGDGTVHYNPDPYTGHDYVEIGGLKWATMNIGASSITDTGLYFAWGDTQGYTAAQVGTGSGQKAFKWEDYKYGNGGSSASDMTKYNSSDGLVTLQSTDDAAVANWGGSWRMPTKDEYVALGNAVNTAWTTNYNGTGISGMVCTAKDGSGAELFFPAAGRCIDGMVKDVGSGVYWSNSLHPSNKAYVYCLLFGNSHVSWQNDDGRCHGLPVRGVVGQ